MDATGTEEGVHHDMFRHKLRGRCTSSAMPMIASRLGLVLRISNLYVICGSIGIVKCTGFKAAQPRKNTRCDECGLKYLLAQPDCA